MILKRILCVIFVGIQIGAWAQHKHVVLNPQKNVLKQIIQSDSFHIKYEKVLQNPAKYHLQVIFTEITRDSNNRARLHKYVLCPETKEYYYPASLVKLPLVAMALEKIDRLNIPGLTKETRLKVDSAYYCQKKQYWDTTAKNHYPSIAHYIKKMLLVSDNYSYNRIYEFLTPAYINKRLKQMGYKKALVVQRFNGSCDTTDNRMTNPFTFLNDSGRIIYQQAPDSNPGSIRNSAAHTIIGKGYRSDDGKVLPPKDFRCNNYIPFENMNSVLLSLIFPKSVDSSKRFHLSEEDYAFLYEYMSMLPRESDYPKYSRKDYPDNYKKYNFFGTQDTINDTTIRSFNIVGRAYGFISDCSDIVDFKNHVEFCLSTLMYVNDKGILNTDDYQYYDIALPFMSDLGHLIYKYELKKKRKHVPDLSRYKCSYP